MLMWKMGLEQSYTPLTDLKPNASRGLELKYLCGVFARSLRPSGIRKMHPIRAKPHELHRLANCDRRTPGTSDLRCLYTMQQKDSSPRMLPMALTDEDVHEYRSERFTHPRMRLKPNAARGLVQKWDGCVFAGSC